MPRTPYPRPEHPLTRRLRGGCRRGVRWLLESSGTTPPRRAVMSRLP
ncbi:hypothetical protein ACWD6K_14185 [Streptomyces sp. NPDC002431]